MVKGNNDLCVSCKLNLCLCECVVKRQGKTHLTTTHKQLQPHLILAKLGVTYSFWNWIPSIPLPAFHDSTAFRKETSYQNHWVLTCVDIHPSISPQKSFHETNRTNVPIEESSRPLCFQFTSGKQRPCPPLTSNSSGKITVKQSVLNLDKAPLVAKMLRISRLGEITLVTPCIYMLV